MLTFTLKRGYLQIYINSIQTSWKEIIDSKYNLSTENYLNVLKQIKTDPHCSKVSEVLLNNFKEIYSNNFKYSYHLIDSETVLKSDKAFIIGSTEHYAVNKIPDVKNRQFNYMSIDSAMKSFELGIAVECNGDHNSCKYHLNL